MKTDAWGELGEGVRLAAQELRAQQLAVTPRHVEHVLNAATARAEQEDAEPMFAEPVPYWLSQAGNEDAPPPGTLSPEAVASLEAERDDLIAGLDAMDFTQRVRGERRILEIERLLHKARLSREAARRDAERQVERRAQRGEMSRKPTEAEIRAELEKPENQYIVAFMNDETGEVRQVIMPRAYWPDKK